MINCNHVFYEPSSKSAFKLIISDISFEAKGITAFIGPNGSGKSSLFKLLCGLEKPKMGVVEFKKQDVFKNFNQLKKEIQILSWDVAPFEENTGDEVLECVKKLSGRWDDELEKKLYRELDIPLGIKVGQMSRGQRAKLSLLITLPRRPKLILIDEITNDLDNDTRKSMYQQLDDYSFETESQVFIATNILEDMERYASHIVLMNGGKILLSEGLDKLKESNTKSLESIYREKIEEVSL